ncbi:hypothetical protein [Spirosoma fluviale]|uniref:Uncharacterized protein n=1 Tax=Spirosoma fluviale TaxID=1597977 RepID=A0A286FCQ7_9BACT|nr:hypothetical protein [Spirosoma fluviale]SOD80876.1 hypothetical protein SAMN06269250_1596 [Spirosoma fluviale]
MNRTELTSAVIEIGKTRPGYIRMNEDICAANTTDYIQQMLGISEFKDQHPKLQELAKQTQHLRSYSKEMVKRSNQLYEDITEPINRKVIFPILEKYMDKRDIPFLFTPTHMFPKPWVSHTEVLFFDTIEQITGAMQELAPHVKFDRQHEDILDSGRGFAVGYELTAWLTAYKEFREQFCNAIID